MLAGSIELHASSKIAGVCAATVLATKAATRTHATPNHGERCSALVAAMGVARLGVSVAVAIGAAVKCRPAYVLGSAVPRRPVSSSSVVKGRVPNGLGGLVPVAACLCVRALNLGRVAKPLDVVAVAGVVVTGLVGARAIASCLRTHGPQTKNQHSENLMCFSHSIVPRPNGHKEFESSDQMCLEGFLSQTAALPNSSRRRDFVHNASTGLLLQAGGHSIQRDQ